MATQQLSSWQGKTGILKGHAYPLMQVRHGPQEGYKHSAHGLLLAHTAPEATQLIKEIAAGRVLHDQVYARLVFKGAILHTEAVVIIHGFNTACALWWNTTSKSP